MPFHLRGPSLEQRITDNVMILHRTEHVIWENNLQVLINIEREEADKKFQTMLKIIIIVMLTIALAYLRIRACYERYEV